MRYSISLNPSKSISTNLLARSFETYNLSLDVVEVLLAVLAGRLGHNLAALATSFGVAISRAILGDCQNNVAIAQLLTSSERRGTAVVTAVAVVGCIPAAAGDQNSSELIS